MTMPYVITTKRGREQVLVENFGPAHTYAEFSRRAVATLEEAREAIRVVADVQRNFPTAKPVYESARRLSKSGGTVGPFPDGTVIEVAPASYDDLITVGLECPDSLGWGMMPSSTRRPAILRAFNAREAVAR